MFSKQTLITIQLIISVDEMLISLMMSFVHLLLNKFYENQIASESSRAEEGEAETNYDSMTICLFCVMEMEIEKKINCPISHYHFHNLVEMYFMFSIWFMSPLHLCWTSECRMPSRRASSDDLFSYDRWWYGMVCYDVVRGGISIQSQMYFFVFQIRDIMFEHKLFNYIHICWK